MVTTVTNTTVATLHTWARGNLRLMAAVDLLDKAGLLDHNWVEQFIHDTDDGRAWIDFETLGRAGSGDPLSGGEDAVLDVALSLTGNRDIDLGGIALSVDAGNLSLILDAIAIAAGMPGVR